MKKLNSIHITPGTAGVNYLDTKLDLQGATEARVVTAGELRCEAFISLVSWLLLEATLHAATEVTAIVEPAGNMVVDAKTQRAVFSLALTLRIAEGESTSDYSSEQLDPVARDVLPELWAAAEREFSTEKPTNNNTNNTQE